MISLTEFLKDPLGHCLRFSQEEVNQLPDSWISRAWKESPEFREEIQSCLLRSVSKVGSLSLAAEWLTFIHSALSVDEVIDLYVLIRDQSDRSEIEEWRREFEEVF